MLSVHENPSPTFPPSPNEIVMRDVTYPLSSPPHSLSLDEMKSILSEYDFPLTSFAVTAPKSRNSPILSPTPTITFLSSVPSLFVRTSFFPFVVFPEIVYFHSLPSKTAEPKLSSNRRATLSAVRWLRYCRSSSIHMMIRY